MNASSVVRVAFVFGAALLCPFSSALSQTASPSPEDALVPSAAAMSYVFGLSLGEQLHFNGVTDGVDFDSVKRGLSDGLRAARLTPEQRLELQVYLKKSIEELRTRNQKASEDFLTQNGQRPGVRTTADGLQYKVLASGRGAMRPVGADDQVTMNYRVRFIDGSEFDHQTAATYGVRELVVAGWREALRMMRPGDKWEVYVPPKLAYGSEQRPRIPANSVLIYDIELISTRPTPSPAGAAGGLQ